MNQVTLIGHVGQMPSVRSFESGKKVMQFSLATTKKLPGKEETQWHNVVAWGYLADLAIEKGTKLLIIGELSYRSYEKEGTTRYITEIVASRFEIIRKLDKLPSSVPQVVNDDIDWE